MRKHKLTSHDQAECTLYARNFPRALRQRVRIHAAQQNTTMEEVFITAVRAYLDDIAKGEKTA
jgi:hypothetical protein